VLASEPMHPEDFPQLTDSDAASFVFLPAKKAQCFVIVFTMIDAAKPLPFAAMTHMERDSAPKTMRVRGIASARRRDTRLAVGLGRG
jgi:hypothetical protein